MVKIGKIGVLGLGSIGRRHADNFEKLGCEVIGYDPLVSEYKTFDEVVHCDGVVVASPSIEHYKQIRLVDRPILAEKPLVINREEYNKVPLDHIHMVGYNLRFHSCVKKVRGWMGEGLIGKPLWARFTCAQYNERPAYQRDGVILNWSHEIDLAIHLLGSVSVLGAAASTTPEDCADVLLQHHRNGCRTSVHLDYLTIPERRGFVIVGDKGSIDCDLVGRQAFIRNLDNKIVHSFFGKDNWDSNYLDEAKMFLRTLVDHSFGPEDVYFCTGRQGYDVVDVCLTAKEMISGKA